MTGFAAAIAHAALTPDVIFLGEIHDNPASHLGQAAQITQIKPTAVVFEMLTEAQAAAANAAALEDIAAATNWADSGWPDFDIYEPIFAALGDAVIYGAGSGREAAMTVFRSGAAEAFGDNALRYGLTESLDPAEQAAREDLQFAAHCDAMPRDMMAGMVEVQRFRDALLADTAHRALVAHGAPVVVITGAGHARTDWGAPALLISAYPEVSITAMAFVEGTPDAPYDDVVIVPEAERDDPCLAFQ